MAESTTRLPFSIKAAHPNVDWEGLAGFRNILVHDYIDVNLHLIWEEIKHRDMLQLKATIEAMLAGMPSNEN
jgi:uncharacterized protein with HEPN domain